MSQSAVPTMAAVQAGFRRSLHAHWRWFLAEGVVLSILGFAALLAPVVAGLMATVFLGWLFLLAGAAGLLFSLAARHAPGFGWALLSAALALVTGAILAWSPMQGMVTLTMVMTAFFAVEGVLVIIMALSHRREMARRWEWMLLNGVIDLVLAGIIVMGMPGSLGWALGIIVGIDMLFGGASLVAMALAARVDDPRTSGARHAAPG